MEKLTINDNDSDVEKHFSAEEEVKQKCEWHEEIQSYIKEINDLIDYYLENAKILRTTFEEMGYVVHGGTDAPYVFVELPESIGGSWDAFSMILEKAQVVTIPGAGFGPGGEGFLRLSAFAPRDSVIEACDRLKETMKLD